MELRFQRRSFVIFSLVVAIVAYFLGAKISPTLRSFIPSLASTSIARPISSLSTKMPSRTPVYFMSHGGPSTMFDTEHPVYPVLQKMGQEITQKVKPKAIVIFSAHWEASPNEIQVNSALMTDLIYDYYGFPPEYYDVKYPNIGSPELASKVINLLQDAGIKAKGTTRGLDHGVYVGFSVAFHPEKNPLNIPIVQVSQYKSQDVDQHYRLGQAVQALRDENILVIGAGMSVHNLRDYRFAFNATQPMPYVASFDNALKSGMEASPSERQAQLAEVAQRPDAHQAHPHFDHLMPAYITAGAGGEDQGKQLWTHHDFSMGWAMYRFGEVPA
ncbi:Extradiol ring-cleavage dioxygenase, class III enzyme, subunit B [Xylaria bambusicola]|uniref:Extradiol ring-cleavage dioxygenase, class III enzyme, subunit B n=1 Tax=Xylaria bambusicola TaxID=326684 RepID=UPI0020083D3B|nr:Extradiol ring-cleavage dioxygenase, class III enzyme, subunit B [Xylaria bambusicola]KAI0509613.1 Extradiol ring-cleavage dioxygenase, class III enzyme, subunit B [Xylaria bambusicola]